MRASSKILYGGLRALQRELTKDEWSSARFTILLDENTFQYCLPQLISNVEPLQEAEFIEVPVGEECKSLEVAAQVWQTMIDSVADRQHVIVNLGGGCVCDLGGFVAAGYKRGVRHIHVPTTLLSMVDASIGGKTAINYAGVKNSIGHFYPSVLTVIDPVFLESLSPMELLNGRMEMVKTAVVTHPSLYEQLLQGNGLAKHQILEVARIKNAVIRRDPEDLGIRKILNFGHTFGHAIERYRGLPHGISVGLGMRVAMYLSTKKLGLADDVYQSYSKWLKSHLSVVPEFNLKDIESLLALMRQDKKNALGTIRCVLLQELGAAVIDVEVSDNEIRDAFLRLHI